MTEPVTPPVMRYERDTNGVRNAAPHHTTPHHTTKNTSSRSMTRPREDNRTFIADQRTITRLQGWTVAIADLRPDWTEPAIRDALMYDDRPWTVVVRAALAAALDPDIHAPGGIRHTATGRTGPTPTPPRWRSGACHCPDCQEAEA